MELWVRSQDKKLLCKTNQFYITEHFAANEIGGYEIRSEFGMLGIYSKTKALEVLNEIQNLLSPMLVFKNCNCTKEMLENIKEAGTCVVSDNAHIEQIQTCIYEMPEE